MGAHNFGANTCWKRFTGRRFSEPRLNQVDGPAQPCKAKRLDVVSATVLGAEAESHPRTRELFSAVERLGQRGNEPFCPTQTVSGFEGLLSRSALPFRRRY